MKKSTKSELTKYLKELDKKGLENEVKKLYDKFKEVKQYYELEFCEDTTEILNQYKKKIKQEYFPSRGFGKARNGVSRKVISDFKKISIFKKDVIELLLFRVHNMMEFTKQYGDIDEPFYNSMENSYEEACKLIKEEKFEKEYREHCKMLLNDSFEYGWGLHDSFAYSYENCFDV